ncbi:MAG TPA: hypothetical protein VGH24_11055 [Solirubrobacteraceae bacterium]
MGVKHKVAVGAAALAAAAFAGGAYAATQSGPGSRQAFFNDVAKRLNVPPDQLRSAVKAALIDRVNAEVKAGRLTQAQANTIERRIDDGNFPLGFGQRFHGGLRHTQLRVAANYLGLTEAQLFQQLRSGKTLAQVASDKGKTPAGLEKAIIDPVKARLDNAVSAGRITEAQEQALLKRVRSRVDRRVNRSLTRDRFQGHHPPPGP